MKAAELRDLGTDELGAKERDLTDQLFRMRIQKSMGQLEAPDKMRTVSGSRRWLVNCEVPGRRRSTSACRSASAISNPGGQPSTTQPSAGP